MRTIENQHSDERGEEAESPQQKQYTLNELLVDMILLSSVAKCIFCFCTYAYALDGFCANKTGVVRLIEEKELLRKLNMYPATMR